MVEPQRRRSGNEGLPEDEVIRTPDRRLRVFVSSTLSELAEERQAVSRAISVLRLTPVMFEVGARPHPPQDLYRAYLGQSDVFVGLYWQQYGWVGPGMEISGLEDEFQLSRALPRLLYVKTPAPDREPRLTEMLAGIEAEGSESYRHFRTPTELGRLVRDDLAMLLSERFAVARPSAAAPPSRPGPRPLPVDATSPATAAPRGPRRRTARSAAPPGRRAPAGPARQGYQRCGRRPGPPPGSGPADRPAAVRGPAPAP